MARGNYPAQRLGEERPRLIEFDHKEIEEHINRDPVAGPCFRALKSGDTSGVFRILRLREREVGDRYLAVSAQVLGGSHAHAIRPDTTDPHEQELRQRYGVAKGQQRPLVLYADHLDPREQVRQIAAVRIALVGPGLEAARVEPQGEPIWPQGMTEAARRYILSYSPGREVEAGAGAVRPEDLKEAERLKAVADKIRRGRSGPEVIGRVAELLRANKISPEVTDRVVGRAGSVAASAQRLAAENLDEEAVRDVIAAELKEEAYRLEPDYRGRFVPSGELALNTAVGVLERKLGIKDPEQMEVYKRIVQSDSIKGARAGHLVGRPPSIPQRWDVNKDGRVVISGYRFEIDGEQYNGSSSALVRAKIKLALLRAFRGKPALPLTKVEAVLAGQGA